MADKNPFDLSLDEIIAMKNDNIPEAESDVLDLGLNDDIDMQDDDFEPPSAPPSVSMASFGRHKDPALSVNIRLRPENIVDRPAGMPPLLSREAQKQMDELDEMKSTNRLHELNNLNSSRSTLNYSSRASGISRATNNFRRNARNDAIGKHGGNGGKRDLRQLLIKTVEKCQEMREMVVPKKENAALDGILGPKKGISEYVDVINANFGPKYNMTIQKEIASLQQKPFLYACGAAKVITQDGSGVNGPKLMALGTKSTINCRFSQL